MRDAVLLIGDYDFDTKSFQERNLYTIKGTVDGSKTYFNNIRAIVVADFPKKFGLVKDCFKKLFTDAENYGIIQIVLSHNDSDFRQIKAIQQSELGSNTTLNKIYSITEITAVAELIARHDPGPPLKNITIEPDELKLDHEVKLLLQRSFFDCEKIYLEPIGGGKASMYLFRVHAWLKDSEVGPLPLPFFAKIASPQQIEREKQNYKTYTDHFISFQYRPNFRPERCIRTRNYSSLVGNFVDDSIPLRAALREIHHNGILFSLFEKSLKGFRLQPFVSKKEATVGPLKVFLEKIISIDRLLKRSDVITMAESLGLKSGVKELCDQLGEASSKIACLTGPLHGDLHSGNVIVRGSDAILIDFYSVMPDGPLTADPASLEISLSFGLEDNERIPSFEDWKAVIDEAYSPDHLLRPLAISDKIPNQLSWLRRAIREIRHILIGCHCCPEEIKIIIAGYLIRYSRLASREQIVTEKDKIAFKRHAYALVVAEGIINSLIIPNKEK